MKLSSKLNSTINSFNEKLPEGKIYVLPTFSGIKTLLLFILLVGLGLIYTNNYIIFLAFFVFFIILISIFLTYENHRLLKTVKVKFNDFYADDIGSGEILFQTLNDSCIYKLNCSSTNKNINVINSNYSDIESNKLYEFSLACKKRGHLDKLRIKIESTFPLNWFRCFSFYNLEPNCYVYPAPKPSLISLNTLTTHNQNNHEIDIKDYIQGEPLTRIVWKKSHISPLQTKYMVVDLGQSISIDLDSVKSEIELSEFSFLLKNINDDIKHISFRSNGMTIEGCGKAFATKCLQLAAVYEI